MINKISIEVWSKASLLLQISFASARNNQHFCKGLAVKTLKVLSFFEKLEDFYLFHVCLRTFTMLH